MECPAHHLVGYRIGKMLVVSMAILQAAKGS